MQVTVTGGVGHNPAILRYSANDLAMKTAIGLAGTIDATYSNAIYYNPSNPPITPSAGYLIIKDKFSSNTIDARGFGAIVDENSGQSTINGGGSRAGQIVLTSNGGLTFTAHSGNTTVVAGGGDNFINFTGDTLSSAAYTSTGNDTIYGGDGNTTISGGSGSNKIVLGAGNSLDYVSGQDTVTLGAGADTIDVLRGGSALVKGTTGTDSTTLVFVGGAAASTVLGGAGSYKISGGIGGGLFEGGSAGDNSIAAGRGAATIVGGGAGDTLLGGNGNDDIKAALGNETLGGGAGHNLFDLGVHLVVGKAGDGTTDVINDFNTKDLLHVGGVLATNYALNTYQIINGSGTFLLEDGTKVVLQGFNHHLSGSNFKI